MPQLRPALDVAWNAPAELVAIGVKLLQAGDVWKAALE